MRATIHEMVNYKMKIKHPNLQTNIPSSKQQDHRLRNSQNVEKTRNARAEHKNCQLYECNRFNCLAANRARS